MSVLSSRGEPVRTTGHEANKPVKRDVSRLMRAGIALAVVTALGWLGGCSDDPCSTCPPPPPPQGLIVSDPAPAGGSAAGAGTASAPASGAGDSVAYVSLPPGTVPAGSWATLRRVGDAATVTDTVRDGGFDPVPVGARAGDSIEVTVRDAGGATVYQVRAEVRAARPPVVVRTDPPRKKTDVPVNAALVVVFSEPVAGGSLTPASVQLLRGESPVAGTVTLLQGTGAVAAFAPTAPLDRNTDYRLVVTAAVRDLEGEALPAPVSVDFTTGQSSTGSAASITVSPDTVWLTGATYQLTATVRDAAGNQLIDQPVAWSTSDPAGLTVSPTGLLTALAAGSYYVDATVNGVLVPGRAQVYVSAGPAASVTVSPTSATVGAAGDTIKLVATVRNEGGHLLDRPSVTWSSSDPAVATVAADSSSSLGRAFATVTGVSPGSATITATSAPASGTAAVTVIPPPPVASVTVIPAAATLVLRATRQLSAAVRDANGKVLAGRPVAWTTDNAAVATVDANGLATGVSAGSATVTATSEGVSGTAAITVTLLSFRSVTTGWWSHSCGLTPSGAVFCWGANDDGQLGDGSTVSGGPVAVSGGLAFSAVSAGDPHTCGVTTSGAAYCWGGNEDGQLGNGSTVSSSVPVAVSGGHTFSSVSAGRAHTCGVTTNGAAYCWGNNGAGQLGDGSTPPSRVPVAVSGRLTFSSVSAGDGHTCGLTTAGAAYCWGSGLLGDGSTSSGSVPVAVSGGLTFSSVSAGFGHTCGVTTTGAAYCWGANNFGQLGDGSINGGPPIGESRSAPVSVVGGLTFAAVSAGHEFTCGIATGGAAYCWGQDWTGTPISVPVAVTGGLTFASLSAGYFLSCGITVDNIAYCWQVGRTPWKVAGQP